MEKIIEIVQTLNVRLALKNIFSKINEIIKNVNSITPYEPSYKIYSALLTQTGISDPVATVLENTIGNVVWTRIGVGQYLGTLVGAFTNGKTISPQFPALSFENNATFLPISSNGNPQLGWVNMYCQSEDYVEIDTYDMVSRTEWSTVLGSSFLIEIRVYN